ncbi:MAG: putative sulfate/molybdate transporter, partial [Candidatus Ranarchaeia archaeon]
KKFPAVLVLLGVGIGIAILTGTFTLDMIQMGFSLPVFLPISWVDIFYGFVVAGLAQIVMTAASAVVATKDVIDQYWPDSRLRHKHLTLNMGVMNSVVPWVGGIPMCHGVGGVVAKKTFGSNSGTSLIFEGVFELILGLLFGGSVLLAFQAFPIYVLGVLLFFTAISLGKVGLSVERRYIPTISLLITALMSVLARVPLAWVGLNPSFSIPLGFILGWLVYAVFDPIEQKKNPREAPTPNGPTMCEP